MIPSHSFVCFAVKHFKHLPGLKLPYGEGMDQTIFPTDDSCRTMVSTDFDVPFEGRHFRIIYVRIMCITSILTVCSEVKIQHMFNAFVFIPNKLCIIFRVTLSFVRKKTQQIFYFFQICPNGLLCFNRPHEAYTIPDGNRFHSEYQNIYCLAPYFTDLNPSRGGKVYYRTYNYLKSNEPTDALETVQNLVEQNYKTTFIPVFILKATWDEVPPYGRYYSQVSGNFRCHLMLIKDYC